jgi:putative heme-binding domain-containing protein
VGLVQSQTDSHFHLVMPGGVTESILKERVATAAPTGRSLMPEGFESAIDEQGMADLISFLKSSR